jgi:hypothetical protein
MANINIQFTFDPLLPNVENQKMHLYLVSKEDAFNIDNAMICVDGSWETGYYLSNETMMLLGIKKNQVCSVGDSSTPLLGQLSIIPYDWTKFLTKDYDLVQSLECLEELIHLNPSLGINRTWLSCAKFYLYNRTERAQHKYITAWFEWIDKPGSKSSLSLVENSEMLLLIIDNINN